MFYLIVMKCGMQVIISSFLTIKYASVIISISMNDENKSMLLDYDSIVKLFIHHITNYFVFIY